MALARVADTSPSTTGFLKAATLGRLVRLVALGDAVGRFETGYTALRADGQVSAIDLAGNGINGLLDVHTVSMCVDHHALAALAPEQVIDRSIQRLALNVPKRHVNRAYRRHGYWPAPPVRAAIEILPDIFRVSGIAPDEAGDDVFAEIADHRKFAAVQRAVAESVDAFVGFYPERDEIASRRADIHGRVGDLHAEFLTWTELARCSRAARAPHRRDGLQSSACLPA